MQHQRVCPLPSGPPRPRKTCKMFIITTALNKAPNQCAPVPTKLANCHHDHRCEASNKRACPRPPLGSRPPRPFCRPPAETSPAVDGDQQDRAQRESGSRAVRGVRRDGARTGGVIGREQPGRVGGVRNGADGAAAQDQPRPLELPGPTEKHQGDWDGDVFSCCPHRTRSIICCVIIDRAEQYPWSFIR